MRNVSQLLLNPEQANTASQQPTNTTTAHYLSSSSQPAHLFFSSSALRSLSVWASPATPASTLRRAEGKPLALSASAADAASSGTVGPLPAGESGSATFTTAVSVSRLTAAACTPGCCSRMRLTAALQPPHFMLRTSSTTASLGTAA